MMLTKTHTKTNKKTKKRENFQEERVHVQRHSYSVFQDILGYIRVLHSLLCLVGVLFGQTKTARVCQGVEGGQGGEDLPADDSPQMRPKIYHGYLRYPLCTVLFLPSTLNILSG